MTAAKLDITIEQGATFKLNATWKDQNGAVVDLTGYSARMQVRDEHSSAAKLLNLTSAGGDITLGGVAGTIAVEVSATDTAALSAPKSAVYDLELEDGSGEVTRLLEGRARITPEVTR